LESRSQMVKLDKTEPASCFVIADGVRQLFTEGN
jgi:hypothetical protein